jgi:hypothetical protein
MECSCAIDGTSDYEFDSVMSVNLIKSRTVHTCGECGKNIQPGEEYELYRAVFDGSPERYKTCLDCLSFRDNFFGDWCFGSLWEQFRYHMDDCGWQVPEGCLAKVTPVTRAKICDLIEKYWEDEDD